MCEEIKSAKEVEVFDTQRLGFMSKGKRIGDGWRK